MQFFLHKQTKLKLDYLLVSQVFTDFSVNSKPILKRLFLRHPLNTVKFSSKNIL